MSTRTIAISPEGLLSTRVSEAPSPDSIPVQSLSRASTDMMLASRPGKYDIVSEPPRPTFETDHIDSEESRHAFISSPSATTASNGNTSQAFPTTTTIQLAPTESKHPLETQHQEKVVHYEVTQNGVKFKGHVKGIKIIVTQVASKTGQYTSENHQHKNGEENNQPQGQGKQNSGFVSQNGAHFFQSVTDTDAEFSQSVGGEDFYIVTQEAVEIEGDVVGGTFINDQRVW